MSSPYPAEVVANSILNSAITNGIQDVSPMKLQKLLYFAHAWFLAIYERPLIQEKFGFWKFGPVVESLYHLYKHFGNSRIEQNVNSEDDDFCSLLSESEIIPEDDFIANDIIRQTLGIYGKYTSIQLSNLTHSEGEPWNLMLKSHKGVVPKGFYIENELIKNVYQSKLKR